jgi:hypothetical protein
MMPKKMTRFTLFVGLLFVLIILGGIVGLKVAEGWIFGVSPRDQYLRFIHSDTPPLRISVQLEQGVPVTFQARIIRKRKYELNLLVYFANKEERATVESLIGTYHSLNSVADPISRMPTTVRIVVQDQDQRVLSDETIRSDGRLVTAARFIGRRLDLLPLEEGIYAVSITPLNDVSPLKSLRIELELNSPPA